MPWFGDFGMLYYRTDLLQKYGYSAPPKTWQELTDMAKKIQDGESASNPQFQGFVFQGSASEGLTCNVVEWIASSGGGQVVENGKVTFDNPNTVAVLKMAQGWVGTISSKAVTNYHEEDARTAFQGGNAAFERNWPYAYVQASDPAKSQVAGKFDVAPLPHGSGASDQSAGTIGGWALGVSKYSKSPDAAVEWVRYLTSPEVEKWRALVGSLVPTIPSVASDPDVQAAEPFLKNVGDVQRVGRPSTALGENYNEASTAIFQGVNQILTGADVQKNVTDIATKITGLLK
jgi:trehalose/maltose transport system substrate-binding protein